MKINTSILDLYNGIFFYVCTITIMCFKYSIHILSKCIPVFLLFYKWYCICLSDFHILLEIGPGWKPAVINSPLELEFVARQHMRLNNSENFWIGGSTESEGQINLTEYMRHQACDGNNYKYCDIQIIS